MKRTLVQDYPQVWRIILSEQTLSEEPCLDTLLDHLGHTLLDHLRAEPSQNTLNYRMSVRRGL
jgi:hypothetical protein